MYSTNVYLYPQKQKVLLLRPDELYKIRWRPVYTKNLRVSKGVDNAILFQFMNQDQKPVDVTGLEFIFRMMNREGNELLLTKNLVIHNIDRGQAKLILTEEELDSISKQLANYSITVEDTASNEPVFVDDNAGARGVIDIEDAVFPEFVPSTFVTVPPSMPAGSSRNFQDNPEVPTTVSSHWNPLYSTQTVQYKLDGFEGVVVFQAADSNVKNGDWFDLDEIEYTDTLGTSGTYYNNVEGMYAKMRIKIDTVQGELKEVYVR